MKILIDSHDSDFSLITTPTGYEYSQQKYNKEQRLRIDVDAVAARIGAGIHLRIDPGVASAAERWADAEVLLGARIRTGARCRRDLGSASALDLHLVASILQLLGEWRTLAQCWALPVNDIDRNDER